MALCCILNARAVNKKEMMIDETFALLECHGSCS